MEENQVSRYAIPEKDRLDVESIAKDMREGREPLLDKIEFITMSGRFYLDVKTNKYYTW